MPNSDSTIRKTSSPVADVLRGGQAAIETFHPIPRPAPQKASTPPPGAKSRFRADIEGLRASAVLLVVLFHAGIPGFSGGFIGVDVFFVLSGYLITQLLLRELVTTNRISLTNFYLRRARRLFPALCVVLVATLLLVRVTVPLMSQSTAIESLWSSAYVVNFHFLASGLDYFAAEQPDSPLLHLWSLAIEEQFYFVWPALLLLMAARMRRKSLHKIAVVTAVIGFASLFACVIVTAHGIWAYFLPFTRLWELLAGALLAALPRFRAQAGARIPGLMAWAGFVGVITAGLAYTSETAFPGIAAALPVVGTMAVVAFSHPNSSIFRVLSISPMQWLGKLSYSLYLWHWPLLALYAGAGSGSQSTPKSIVAVIAAVLLSWLTYHLVENPIRRSKLLASSKLLSVIFMAVVLVIPVSVAAWSLANPPNTAGTGSQAKKIDLAAAAQPMREYKKALEASTNVDELPRNIDPPIDSFSKSGAAAYSKKRASKSTPSALRLHCRDTVITGELDLDKCGIGSPNSNSRIVLFGDSHAYHWMPALRMLAERNSWRVVLSVRGGCPSLDISATGKSCDSWRTNSLRLIEKEKPSLVILSNHHRYCTKADCPGGILSIVRKIRAINPGVEIVVMEDVPRRTTHVPTCLSTNNAAIQQCADTRQHADAQPRATIAAAVRQSQAHWIPTTEWFCTDSTCPPIIGNTLVMRDNNHITPEMAELLAPLLGEMIDQYVSQ